MAKGKIYKVFFDRMTAALKADAPFEASWYAYAVLEDRLVSMMLHSGGPIIRKGKPVRSTMGPKIEELWKRSRADNLLKVNLPESDIKHDSTKLWKWKDSRDTLMHGMADGSLTIEQIDAMVSKVATGGAELARAYADAARRLKKHRKKVPN